MSEILTIEEIKERFPSQHVLLEDPMTKENSQQVHGGRVRWHSTDRDEVYRKMGELHIRYAAFVFTGVTPDEMHFALNIR